MGITPWLARTPEDVLLEQYWTKHGGRLYLEVPIGGCGSPGGWLPGCTVRRLDGVRVLSSSTPESISRYAAAKAAFATDLQAVPAELLEVKLALNRTAIGQAIAGRHMFRRQYGVTPSSTKILCRVSDSALEWVCGEEEVQVEVVAS